MNKDKFITMIFGVPPIKRWDIFFRIPLHIAVISISFYLIMRKLPYAEDKIYGSKLFSICFIVSAFYTFIMFNYKTYSEQINTSFEVINSRRKFNFLSFIVKFCSFLSIAFYLYYIQNYLSSFPLNIRTVTSTQELEQRPIFDRYLELKNFELNKAIIGNYNTFDIGLRQSRLSRKNSLSYSSLNDMIGFNIYLVKPILADQNSSENQDIYYYWVGFNCSYVVNDTDHSETKLNEYITYFKGQCLTKFNAQNFKFFDSEPSNNSSQDYYQAIQTVTDKITGNAENYAHILVPMEIDFQDYKNKQNFQLVLALISYIIANIFLSIIGFSWVKEK